MIIWSVSEYTYLKSLTKHTSLIIVGSLDSRVYLLSNYISIQEYWVRQSYQNSSQEQF